MATQFPAAPTSPSIVGWILALLVLLIAVVLMVVGQLEIRLGLLISGLALARLL